MRILHIGAILAAAICILPNAAHADDKKKPKTQTQIFACVDALYDCVTNCIKAMPFGPARDGCQEACWSGYDSCAGPARRFTLDRRRLGLGPKIPPHFSPATGGLLDPGKGTGPNGPAPTGAPVAPVAPAPVKIL